MVIIFREFFVSFSPSVIFFQIYSA